MLKYYLLVFAGGGALVTLEKVNVISYSAGKSDSK